MSRGIFIIGTDTDVGKTVVSAGLMNLLLKNQLRAAYFKPVASGEVDWEGAKAPADAAFVRAVSGFSEPFANVSPFSFADAVAPHLAARLAGTRIDPTLVRKHLLDLTSRYEIIVAEGAGGLAIPLDDEGGWMQYELIRDLNFPCLLVARAGLGTINHTLLTLRLAKSVGLRVKGVVVNRAGDSLMERDNIGMIKKLAGSGPVFTLPEVRGLNPEKLQPGELGSNFEKSISLTDVLALMERI